MGSYKPFTTTDEFDWTEIAATPELYADDLDYIRHDDILVAAREVFDDAMIRAIGERSVQRAAH